MSLALTAKEQQMLAVVLREMNDVPNVSSMLSLSSVAAVAACSTTTTRYFAYVGIVIALAASYHIAAVIHTQSLPNSGMNESYFSRNVAPMFGFSCEVSWAYYQNQQHSFLSNSVWIYDLLHALTNTRLISTRSPRRSAFPMRAMLALLLRRSGTS